MKTSFKIILAVTISGILFIIIGFLVGRNVGNQEIIDSPPSYLRNLLKHKEIEQIISQLEINSELIKVDEGGLFSTKYVNYIKGYIKNNSNVAKAKDLKLDVTFFSKTGTSIGETELTIYEYVNPLSSLDFKEKVNVPENTDKFSCTIKSAGGE
jgi:hypothetical protein